MERFRRLSSLGAFTAGSEQNYPSNVQYLWKINRDGLWGLLARCISSVYQYVFDVMNLVYRQQRFVPVDESLPSMPYNNLALFQKSFRKFDREVRAKLLDHWPASSKRVKMAQEGRGMKLQHRSTRMVWQAKYRF